MPPYRKKRKTYRKAPYTKRKTMAKIAKAVVMRTTETKQNTGGINSSIVQNNSTSSYLITRYCESGVNDNQFTGNKIQIRSMYVKLLVRVPPVAGVQWCSQVRMLLVSTDEKIAWDSNVPSDFYYPLSAGSPAGGTALTAKINVKKYSIISDRTFQLTPQSTTSDGFNKVVSLQKSFRRGINIEFENTATSGTQNYAKNKNYYVVLIAGGWSNITANIEFRGTLYLKYKDI